MKKKWLVIIGCIIINLCNVGYLQKHEDTGSSISVIYINDVPFRCYEKDGQWLYVKAKDLEKLGFETTYDEASNKWYIERPNGEIATEQYKDEVITPIPNVSYTREGKREEKIKLEGDSPAFINCNAQLMINEDIFEHIANIQDITKIEGKNEKEKKQQEEMFHSVYTKITDKMKKEPIKIEGTMPLKNYLGVEARSNFLLYSGFYLFGQSCDLLRLTTDREEAYYYRISTLDYMGIAYEIIENQMIIQPLKEEIRISPEMRSTYAMSQMSPYDEPNEKRKTDFDYVDLKPYCDKEEIKVKGISPPLLLCVMVNCWFMKMLCTFL